MIYLPQGRVRKEHGWGIAPAAPFGRAFKNTPIEKRKEKHHPGADTAGRVSDSAP